MDGIRYIDNNILVQIASVKHLHSQGTPLHTASTTLAIRQAFKVCELTLSVQSILSLWCFPMKIWRCLALKKRRITHTKKELNIEKKNHSLRSNGSFRKY